jgi:transposase
MAQGTDCVAIGVDTHADVHVAAALDPLGRLLGRLEVATNARGYAQLLRWSQSFRSSAVYGVEGTGAYGAGLARYLVAVGCVVIEINRPDRRARRAHGKSDPLDAEAAARAVLAGGSVCLAKQDQDTVGMIRTLRVARRSAMKMRTQVGNQMHALVITAPESVRHELRALPLDRLVAVAAALRPGAITTPTAATKLALRSLAVRHQGLSRELATLDRELERLTVEACPPVE